MKDYVNYSLNTPAWIKKVLDTIRSGKGFVLEARVKWENQLKLYALEGRIDQEEAHLAIIEGKKNAAKIVLKCIRSGFERAYKGDLNMLVRRRYIDQEDAHLALIEGTKPYAEIILQTIREGGIESSEHDYRRDLGDLVRRGHISRDDANDALRTGLDKLRWERY